MKNNFQLPVRFWSLADLFWFMALLGTGTFLFVNVLQGDFSLFFILILHIFVILGFTFILVKWEKGAIPFFEIGFFYAVVVLSYGIAPLIFHLANPGRYRLTPFWRFASKYNAFEGVAFFFVLYLAVFCASYLAVRRKLPQKSSRAPVARKGTVTLMVILFFIITIEAFFYMLKFVYKIPIASTYGETYLLYSGLPLVLRQAANHLTHILLTLKILFMVIIFQRHKKWRYLVWTWLAFEFLSVFGQMKARHGFMMLVLSYLLVYHFKVKPLKAKTIITLFLVFLLIFMLMGLVRGQILDKNVNILSKMWGGSQEFMALFRNSADIDYLKKSDQIEGIEPVSRYLSELLRFVPQQFLPFKKVDMSRWFVETYYSDIAQRGGGLVFGAIPESILGFGVIELILRAALLGILFALVQRYFVFNRENFYFFAFYIWLFVHSYISFRTGTFALLSPIIYQFLLPVAVITFTTGVIERGIANAEKGV